MNVSNAPDVVKQFRKKVWRFQQTFLTPLKDLPTFVEAIVNGEGFLGGCLVVDKVIFDPENLTNLLSSHAIAPRYLFDVSISAHGQQEVVSLLEAAFGDSVDFIFVPEPPKFAIFADHDEYTTFFADSQSNLDHVVTKLLAQRFEAQDYEREL